MTEANKVPSEVPSLIFVQRCAILAFFLLSDVIIDWGPYLCPIFNCLKNTPLQYSDNSALRHLFEHKLIVNVSRIPKTVYHNIIKITQHYLHRCYTMITKDTFYLQKIIVKIYFPFYKSKHKVLDPCIWVFSKSPK